MLRHCWSALITLLVLFSAAPTVSSQPASMQTEFAEPLLDSAMGVLGMKPSDFESDRIWADDDTFLLPRIRESLRSPQAAYRVAKEFARAVPSSISEAGRVNEMAEFLNAACPDVVCRDVDAQLAAARPATIDPFEPMLTAFALAEGYRVQAFAKLSPAEQQCLVMSAPLWFEERDFPEDDSLKGSLFRAFGATIDTSQKVDADSVLTLLSRVNRDALSAATYAFARGLSITSEHWKTAKSPFSVTQVSGASGLVLATRETPYGSFVMGGTGPNTYSRDFALIIDLGGDDQYLARAGSAVANLNHTVSAVIDLNGNDVYLSDAMADQACGVLGLGALIDLSGNDIYRAGAFAQGAAFCGAGLFFDGGGDDLYRAGVFGQAAAVCGIALLIDGGGRDVYDVAEYGQAFSSTFAAAALRDRSGNDLYRAGGLVLHSPLLPEDYRSFAQGFSIGWRPRAGGGISLLHDLAGNDTYDAEVYAQGVSYWYSLGALVDEAGNDVYSATQYAQGAGIHLAAGVLEDRAGDDRYGSRFGPGQGGAHDLSVGLLYDHGGDDQYTMSGGQGTALTNSGALLFDAFGNDSYFITEKQYGQGSVRDARGFGNLGVFVDGEGRDIYIGDAKSDSSFWLQGLFGVGYDLARDSVRPREASVDVTLQPQDTLPSIEELFRVASLWEVTDNREKVKRARLALAAKGVAAIRWVGQHKLNTLDGLERRAIIELFKTSPDSAAPHLEFALNKPNVASRRNAVVVFGEIKYRPAVPLLIDKLHDPSFERLRPAILTALGDIGDASAMSSLSEFVDSPSERERIAATVSLGKIAVEGAYTPIFSRLNDPLWSVRSAAILATAAQGPEIIPHLTRAAEGAEVDELEPLLVAVGRLAERWRTDEKLRKSISKLSPFVRKYIEHPDSRVQGAALAAAGSVLDQKDLDKLLARFRRTTDPLLKARLGQMTVTH